MTHYESEWFDDTAERLERVAEMHTEMETRICKYWRRGIISEGQAAHLLDMDRVHARSLRKNLLKEK